MDVEEIIRVAVNAQPGIRLVLLFGSLATGRGGFKSDLDVAVDADQPLTADEKIVLISTLAERIGRPIDLVDLSTAGEPLRGEILRHGKKILGSPNHYANLIRRHIFDQADYLPYRNRILAERMRRWIGR